MPFIGNKPSAVPLTSADIADGIITSAKIADGTIVNADINASAAIASTKLSGAGISEADQWRITTNQTSTASYVIVTNWERNDNSGFGYLGTGMTESSGIFTFASTGIYHINAIGSFLQSGGGSNGNFFRILTTINNSSYTSQANAPTSSDATDRNTVCVSQFIFDVTSTANCKVKFEVLGFNGALQGSTTENKTHVTFTRLGDT
jgi:hypothetical protein